MINKELASSLGPLVKSANWRQIQDYIKYRLDFYNLQLQSATKWEDVKYYQGAIKELKRLGTLKEEAEGVMKNG